MSTSYAISQNYNFQSVLWFVVGAAYRGAVAVRGALPSLLAALRVLCVALGLTAGLVAAVVLSVVYWPVVLCVSLIVAFAYVTFPRSSSKAVTNG